MKYHKTCMFLCLFVLLFSGIYAEEMFSPWIEISKIDKKIIEDNEFIIVYKKIKPDFPAWIELSKPSELDRFVTHYMPVKLSEKDLMEMNNIWKKQSGNVLKF